MGAMVGSSSALGAAGVDFSYYEYDGLVLRYHGVGSITVDAPTKIRHNKRLTWTFEWLQRHENIALN